MLTRICLARLARSFFALSLLVGLAAVFHAQSVAPKVALPAGFATIDPFTQSRLMARGVNVLGYDPIWADFSKGRFKKEYFRKIHDAGFATVRVNLQAFQYMTAENKLPDSWFRMLDWVVANATEAHLQVILDEHDFKYCGETSYVECKPKLLSIWQQVAPRYRDTPNSVTFELLNEPHGLISSQEWNSLFPELLAIVRKTNPTRNVIIGPGDWNSRAALKELALPGDDGHIIVTFHYYEPLPFTHQGAPWASEEIRSGHDIAWGKPEDQLIVERDFDGVAQWGQEHHRPILLGEFGCYDKVPQESRVGWDAFIRKTAEDRGFSWAYWQFDADFVVYDVETNKWNEPILKALIPNSR
jgi:endoglucanase